jgi:hypothetical protein
LPFGIGGIKVTEQSLINFLQEYKIEPYWNGEELIAEICFGFLNEFIKVIKTEYLNESDDNFVALDDGYIYIDLVPICKYWDVEVENIMIKQN